MTLTNGNQQKKKRIRVIIAVTGTILAAIAVLIAFIVFVPGKASIPGPIGSPTTPTINWRHNPSLPTPQGYSGLGAPTSITGSESVTKNGIAVSVKSNQVLVVGGYEGKIPGLEPLGRDPHCFLVMTRGPFSSTIDLVAGSAVVYEASPDANTLLLAAQTVKDQQSSFPECAKGVDVWIGR